MSLPDRLHEGICQKGASITLAKADHMKECFVKDTASKDEEIARMSRELTSSQRDLAEAPTYPTYRGILHIMDITFSCMINGLTLPS